jgi:GxxExxY protein
VQLPVLYDDTRIDVGYRLDLLVEETVVVEVKAVEELAPIHKAQVLTYLRLAGLHCGILINFNVAHLRDGIKRIIHGGRPSDDLKSSVSSASSVVTS